jgi:hypothetical protein
VTECVLFGSTGGLEEEATLAAGGPAGAALVAAAWDAEFVAAVCGLVPGSARPGPAGGPVRATIGAPALGRTLCAGELAGGCLTADPAPGVPVAPAVLFGVNGDGTYADLAGWNLGAMGAWRAV